jgi:indole-3-glycerol phosphate synthase
MRAVAPPQQGIQSMTESPGLPPRAGHSAPPILDQIYQRRRVRVEEARQRIAEADLRRQAEARRPRPFAAALAGAARPHHPAVIAELKQASPSKGRLRHDFDVATLARGYEQAGATALSVLTEEDFFLGHLDNLGLARQATALPLLRKDFLFCDYQIWEAAAAGADAILLIAAMLDDAEMAHLLHTAEQAGLDALCEVHDAAELQRVSRLGARLIGVNNRDLRTFHVDVQRSVDLAAQMPPGSIRVAESGLRTAADLVKVSAAGFHAVLIGEHFMTAADPGAALAQLLAGLPQPVETQR